jgi:hypothetical protein
MYHGTRDATSSLEVDVLECSVNGADRLASCCGIGSGRDIRAGVDGRGCPVCGVEQVVVGGLFDAVERVGGEVGW